MLVMHPRIQEQVFEEISTVFTTQDETILNEHLTRMPYIDAVLTETMRLFPAAPHPLCTATTDIQN